MFFRAIQRHSGGMISQPELMNYVLIPYKWKQFICHTGRARDRFSIAEVGLVTGDKESKEGRQAIFFTPLDPCHSDSSEAESITDLLKPRKVHHQTHCGLEQDAVCWMNVSRAQDSGLKFWQTQSHAIIVYRSVPKEYVERVVSENGGRELFTRQLTPRRGSKVTFRNTWVKSDSSTTHQLRETDACQAVLTKPSFFRESHSARSRQ